MGKHLPLKRKAYISHKHFVPFLAGGAKLANPTAQVKFKKKGAPVYIPGVSRVILTLVGKALVNLREPPDPNVLEMPLRPETRSAP